ncbi:MAG TPA: ABC transporter substrate-binding protein [Usitatibacteraceae bacterium]|nr:ABC transporter substrate-binding protein [Usitatibacteraceae bacterium]
MRLAALLVCLCIGSGASAKTLRAAFLIAETAFDPHAVSDLYSNAINDAIFDPLLKYDYLAQPVRLIPNTAAAMPEVGDGGRTYTFRIRPGIHFADDPVFRGVKREVTAADYAYSIKRLYDPAIRSPWLWYVEGKIVGGDEAMEAAKKNGRFDYDAPLAGLEVPDRYTLRIRLKNADFNFIYVLATVQTGAVAREVVEHYGSDIGAHPVGSGPFRLAEWKRSHKIVLTRNPNFREERFEANPAAGDAEGEAIVRALRGKRLPIIDRVEVSIIEESQPRWLAFLNGELDYANVPLEFSGTAFPGGKLAPFLEKKGIRGQRFVEPDLVYTFFNMEDPVLGGYGAERVALRRAISLAYNFHEDIQVIRRGSAVKAESPIPPGVAGYDKDFRSAQMAYDPARARALLDMVGYVDRDGDGFREAPDGKPLVIEMASEPDSTSKQFQELWKKNLEAIGLRLSFRVAKWPELNKQAKAGQLAMWQVAWSADYPDGENFLQNLYGPNTGQSNIARFRLKAFDELFERASRMPPSAERDKLYVQMCRLVAAYAPWIPQTHRQRSEVSHPWVVGYRKHPMYAQVWKYVDIDEGRRAAGGP